jgi:hypothetical protein
MSGQLCHLCIRDLSLGFVCTRQWGVDTNGMHKEIIFFKKGHQFARCAVLYKHRNLPKRTIARRYVISVVSLSNVGQTKWMLLGMEISVFMHISCRENTQKFFVLYISALEWHVSIKRAENGLRWFTYDTA